MNHNPTDEELNAAFAEKVAGWHRVTTKGFVMDAWRDENDSFHMRTPDYCKSADAVMPHLEKHHWMGHSNGMSMSTNGYPHFTIKIGPAFEYEGHCFEGDNLGHCFAKAAVIALLRAHGEEVEFTK